MNPEKLNKILTTGILILAGSLIFSLAIAQAVAVLLTLIWIVKLFLQKKIDLKKSPFIYPFLFFIAVRIISVFFSTDIAASAQIFRKEVFFYFLFFIVVDVFPINDKKYLKIFFLILISAAVISSIYGTGKVLFGLEERASSTTSGYSTLGMFLTAITAVVLALGSEKFFFPSKWLWTLCLAVIVTGILFTFNRTHWGITALMFLIVGFLRERKTVLILSVLAVILISVVPALRERFYQMIFFTDNLSDRNTLWRGAGMILWKRPILGFGPITFREIFPLLNKLADTGVSSWHCDYLQMYMESGIFGLLAFLWLAFSIFYFGIKTLKSKLTDILYKNITLAIVLGMSCFYLTALVGGFILDPISSLLFQLFLGFLALNYHKQDSKNPQTS